MQLAGDGVFGPEGFAKVFMQLAGTHEGDRRADHLDAPCPVAPTDCDHPSTSIRRLEPQRAVRTVLVAVLDIDSQDPLQMPSPDDREPVKG
jgi:hypothetical protein